MWILMAILSAIFAGITSILIKCGIKKTDSDIANAIRTIVVLFFSFIMVLIKGSISTVSEISAKSFIFLILSGIATGLSWLCYFKALSIGDINKVLPIDKSSTILTVIFAIILFGETKNLIIKLICTMLLAIGTYFMIEKKTDSKKEIRKSWLPYAIFSSIFAAFTSILAKVGIENVESNLGTFIRTIVVLIMAWIIVFIKGKQKLVLDLDRKELGFIGLSGIATGASWLCYYYAIQNGIVSIVVPIDKLSILVSIFFSYIVFKEKLSKKGMLGLFLILVSTLVMAILT